MNDPTKKQIEIVTAALAKKGVISVMQAAVIVEAIEFCVKNDEANVHILREFGTYGIVSLRHLLDTGLDVDDFC